ncbi:MAG: ABC transporter ATP-binding protein [Proteobacteria bacterium]|nr:ABC transporter ATP-binding protein [Pseudomonadota bacterium]
MISVEKLQFSYGDRLIFNDLNCFFEKGRFIGILGKNGSGKSTLIKIIARFERSYKGEVRFHQKIAESFSMKDFSKLVGYLPQIHYPIYPYKVLDVVLTGRMPYFSFYPTKKDIDISVSALQKLNIEHFKDRRYTELSGGEQKLVLLSRLIAQNPDIIILDEPLTNLDLHNQIHIIKILKDLVKEGKSIITVLHEVSIAYLYCDDLYFLKDGEIIKKEKDDIDIDFLEKIFNVSFKIIFDENKYIVLKV